MDVSVIGAGAVGIVLADALQKAGVSCELVARSGRATTLSERGAWLKWEEKSVQGVRVPIAEHASGRVLLLAVKTYALPLALAEHCAGREDDYEIVALQNGLGADKVLADKVPKARRIGGVVSFTATSLRPGEVSVMAHAPKDVRLTLGEDDRDVRSSQTFALLSKAVNVGVAKRLENARWTKLLVNLNNGLFAATGLPASRFFAHPYGVYVAARALREGLQVAKAIGVSLESLPNTSRFGLWAARVFPIGIAAGFIRRRAEALQIAETETYGSTLQSVMKNEPTEIDDLNGAIVRLAKPVQVPVPINDAATLAVRAVSRGEAPISIDALAQL